MEENKAAMLFEYLEEHLDEELDLDKIADYIGYSKFHLNRLFAEKVGCTIYKYIQKRRLTEAARKLVLTDQSIVEIAYEASYHSQQAFTLAFKQVYGCPPQVYRRNGLFIPAQTPINFHAPFSSGSGAVIKMSGVAA